MRFFKLALASAGILAATSHAAPVEVRSSGLSGNTANTGSASVECGWFLKIEEDGPMPLYANGHIENVEEFTHMIGIFVETCGICMAFRERDGQGDILWSGGPGQDSGGTVRGAQSYYCIYGRQAGEVTDQIKNFPGHTVYGTPTGEAAWIIKNTTGHNAVAEAAETVKAVGACDTPTTTKVACGQYYNNQQQGPFDLFANGNYENLALGTTMTSARVDSCGICIVFSGRDAQGSSLWSGGPNDYAGLAVKGGQSYYCIYGKEAEAAPTTVAPINARASSGPVSSPTSVTEIPILSNPIMPPRAPQFPCGSLGTVNQDGKTDQIPIWSDKQYYIEDDSNITWFSNEYCALCGVFNSRFPDADMLYTIELSANTTGKEGGKSYFCYGK